MDRIPVKVYVLYEEDVIIVPEDAYYSYYKVLGLNESNIVNEKIRVGFENLPPITHRTFLLHQSNYVELPIKRKGDYCFAILAPPPTAVPPSGSTYETYRLFIEKLPSLEKSLKTFEFYVNPIQIVPTERKLVTEIKTKGGYLIEQWGPALGDIRISGITGKLYDEYSLIQKQTRVPTYDDMLDSIAMKNFKELKDLFDQFNTGIGESVYFALKVLDTLYVGYFVEFTGPVQALDKPYYFTYDISFRFFKKYYIGIR